VDNQATTSLAIVQARRFTLFSQIARTSDETDAKKIITALPLENWRRPVGHPRTAWMKQDLKSNNISLNEATDMTLETDVNVWRYALLVVHVRNE